MSKIKTAYEMAMERIIETRYKPIKQFDDMVDFGDEKDEDLPDFVLDWKKPYKNQDKEIEFVTWQNTTIKPQTAKDLGINVQQVETYHYEENDIIDVYWHGAFEEYNSTCRAARAIIFGLGSNNIRTKLDIKPSRKDINDTTKKELEMLTKHELSKNYIHIYHECLPQDIVPNNSISFSNVCSSEEFSDISTINILNKMREVWVTSRYGKNIMEKNGIKVPIYVVPYGLDQNRYSEKSSPSKINIETNNFILLSIFRWEKYKNYSIMLKAFMNEFSSNDDISFLMVTKHDSSDKIMKDFSSIRDTIDKNNEDLPHIVLYDKIIPEKDMPGLYSFSSAYISLAAKNSSLTFLESSSVGKPVISGKWGVQSDFLTDDNSFLIKNNLDIMQEIQNKMRYVFENYEIAKNKNKNLQNSIKKLSWDNTIKIISERLNQNKG